jgi:hypothetical protein
MRCKAPRAQQRHRTLQPAEAQAALRAAKHLAHSSGTARCNWLKQMQHGAQ